MAGISRGNPAGGKGQGEEGKSTRVGMHNASSSLLLAPLVLLADLRLLLLREVVLDVKGLADLLGGLALDHIGHRLARDIQQSLDIQIVSGQNQFKERALVHLQELLVPHGDIIRTLLPVLVVLWGRGVVLVVGAPLDHLCRTRS